MDLGLAISVWPWVWLAVAVVFAIVEVTILGGSMVLLPFAVSAVISSVLAFYEAPIEVQWLVFGLGGAILFAVFLRWAGLLRDGNVLPSGVGANRLVGRIALVTEAIGPEGVGPVGQVTVDSESWGAVTNGTATIDPGAQVTIRQVRGTRVLVEPLDQPAGDGPARPPTPPPSPPQNPPVPPTDRPGPPPGRTTGPPDSSDHVDDQKAQP